MYVRVCVCVCVCVAFVCVCICVSVYHRFFVDTLIVANISLTYFTFLFQTKINRLFWRRICDNCFILDAVPSSPSYKVRIKYSLLISQEKIQGNDITRLLNILKEGKLGKYKRQNEILRKWIEWVSLLVVVRNFHCFLIIWLLPKRKQDNNGDCSQDTIKKLTLI